MRAALLLATLLAGTPESGWAAGKNTLAPEPITRIVVAPDTSGSLDPRECAKALQGVGVFVRQFVETRSLSQLVVLPWATSLDCRRSPLWSVTLPAQVEAPPEKLQLGDSGRLFRLCREREIEKARRYRDQRQRQLDAAYQERLEPCLLEFERALERCLQGRANCTSISGILKRCSEEVPSTLVIIVTDGKQECTPLAAGVLTEGARTLVVLVPSRENPAADGLAARVTAIRSVAPWAAVVPSFRLSDPAFDCEQVLAGKRDGTESSGSPASFLNGARGSR